jgi:hypothetical protein
MPASSANLDIVSREEAEFSVTFADPPALVHLAEESVDKTCTAQATGQIEKYT